jgi:hypothetical protein
MAFVAQKSFSSTVVLILLFWQVLTARIVYLSRRSSAMAHTVSLSQHRTAEMTDSSEPTPAMSIVSARRPIGLSRHPTRHIDMESPRTALKEVKESRIHCHLGIVPKAVGNGIRMRWKRGGDITLFLREKPESSFSRIFIPC